MYFVFDSQNGICQLGLGSLDQASLRAGIFVPQPSGNECAFTKESEPALKKVADVWIWQSAQRPGNSQKQPHSAHYRFTWRKIKQTRKIFWGAQKAVAALQTFLMLLNKNGQKKRIGLRTLCSTIVLWNFFAFGSSGSLLMVAENTLQNRTPYDTASFIEELGKTPLAQKISKEKRIFSSGEIPKLQGMRQYRYLPLASSLQKEDEGTQILLFAPVKSFISVEHGNAVLQRENALLECENLGVFLISKKDLLLLPERELMTPDSIPHYALYAIDPVTAKTFADAKSCAEIPVNLKEAFSFL